MEKIIKFIAVETIYNGHLQSLSAASVVYVSYILIADKIINIPLLFIVYLIFELIFLFDRYKDIEKDTITNSVRSKHLAKYKNIVPYILVGMFLLIIFIHNKYSNPISFAVSSVIIIFGTLYNLYLKKLTKIIPMFKNFYVASFYALIAFFPYIFLEQNYSLNTSLILLSFAFFIQMMFDQIFLDIKDIDSDHKNGLLTFPVLFNKENTLSFLSKYNLLLFSLLMILAVYFANYVLAFLFLSGLFLNITQLIFFRVKPVAPFVMSAAKIIFWAILFSVIINVV